MAPISREFRDAVIDKILRICNSLDMDSPVDRFVYGTLKKEIANVQIRAIAGIYSFDTDQVIFPKYDDNHKGVVVSLNRFPHPESDIRFYQNEANGRDLYFIESDYPVSSFIVYDKNYKNKQLICGDSMDRFEKWILKTVLGTTTSLGASF